MTLITTPEIETEIIYPESDGQPMGETDIHRDSMIALIEALKDRYRDDPNVYVSGDLFLYYEKGNPKAVFVPDAFVVFGVPKRERRTYKLWEEGGQAPDVVFEVSSESTSAEDEGNKKTRCRRLGVQEYYLYDPKGEYLEPRLQGYHLQENRYIALPFDAAKGLYSNVLDLYLRLEDGRLRLVDAQSGERLLTPLEAQAARRRAEAEATAEASGSPPGGSGGYGRSNRPPPGRSGTGSFTCRTRTVASTTNGGDLSVRNGTPKAIYLPVNRSDEECHS